MTVKEKIDFIIKQFKKYGIKTYPIRVSDTGVKKADNGHRIIWEGTDLYVYPKWVNNPDKDVAYITKMDDCQEYVGTTIYPIDITNDNVLIAHCQYKENKLDELDDAKDVLSYNKDILQHTILFPKKKSGKEPTKHQMAQTIIEQADKIDRLTKVVKILLGE